MMNIKSFLLLAVGSLCYFSQAQSHINSLPAVADSIYSEILGEERIIYVKVPKDYKANSHIVYPVTYVVDGEFILTTADLVHSYYSGGFMPEMVLVGIFNDKNRNRDLTTSVVDGTPQKNGQAEKFSIFIETELIPYVEEKYPVSDYRTLIGHSYGGLFTVNALLKHSEVFDNYLAIDPSLFWDKQQLLKESEEILKKGDFTGKSLFISLGGQLHMADSNITLDNVMDDDSEYTVFARSNLKFKELLDSNSQNGLNSKWKFYPKDLHGTITLPSIMDGLIYLFEWYQMEHTDRINSPDTSVEELSKIVKHREEKLAKHLGYVVPPYPEYLLNMSGYMNMDMGHMQKSKFYFDLAVEYFPESANVYDSRADYYLKVKEYKQALKEVEKAYEISGSDYHKNRIEEVKQKI